MKRVTVALKCPSCAGSLRIREGDTHTVCPSCGSSLYMSNAVRKYVLPSEVGSLDVLRSVRRKLHEINPRITGKARVGRPRLYYVPFWHCRAQVNGYVLGVEPVYREEQIPVVDSEGHGVGGYSVITTRTVKSRTGSEAVEREIQISGSVNISGADLRPLGIPSLNSDSQMSLQGLDIQKSALPEGLEVLDDDDPREGVFVDPVVSLARARKETAQYLRRLGAGAGFGLEERWEHILVTGHRDNLVYYPLWITEFMSGGRSFQAVVDGRTGEVIRGRFPTTHRDRRVITMMAAILWAILLPIFTDLIVSGKLDYRNSSGGQSSCLPVVLLAIGGLAYGTYRLLSILEGLKGRASDVII